MNGIHCKQPGPHQKHKKKKNMKTMNAKTSPDNDKMKSICSERFLYLAVQMEVVESEVGHLLGEVGHLLLILHLLHALLLLPATSCLALLLTLAGLILNEQPLTVYSQPGCSLTPISFFPITSHMSHDVKYKFTGEASEAR